MIIGWSTEIVPRYRATKKNRCDEPDQHDIDSTHAIQQDVEDVGINPTAIAAMGFLLQSQHVQGCFTALE